MSKGLTETKCPFHANAKRSDIVAKLLEEDYYQPVMNGMIDIGGHWIVELTEQQVFNIFEGIYETEGIGEYDMPKDLNYVSDLWNVTIKEYENE